MGLIKNWRRQRLNKATGINWDNLVPTAVIGEELLRAEQAGLPENAQTERAIEIRDAVIDKLGWEPIIDAFINSHRNAGAAQRVFIALDPILIPGAAAAFADKYFYEHTGAEKSIDNEVTEAIADAITNEPPPGYPIGDDENMWPQITAQALEVSGYNRVRAELFPEAH